MKKEIITPGYYSRKYSIYCTNILHIINSLKIINDLLTFSISSSNFIRQWPQKFGALALATHMWFVFVKDKGFSPG